MIRLLFLLLLPTAALAGPRDDALDKVYEAADAIDAARAEQEAGRDDEVVRLLADAEGLLITARALDPALPRIGFEQARLFMLRGKPKAAAEAITPSLKLEMALDQHLRMASLLDTIRADMGQPPLGVAWTQARAMRDAGIVTLAAGLAVTAAGLAVAYTSFDDAVQGGVTDDTLARNEAGWALTGLGGGVTAGGAGLLVAGQVRVSLLAQILPGPWRLPKTRRDARSTRRAPETTLGLALSGTFR